MARLVYRCYAKINLTLEVLRRREDGYHELASLVHTIGLADDLHIVRRVLFRSRTSSFSQPSSLLRQLACGPVLSSP